MNPEEFTLGYNSTFTLANFFDELDAVIGGLKAPDYNFIFNFNSFVESFVLTDSFILHQQDYSQIQLFGNAIFPNGRPIFDLVNRNEMLRIFDMPTGASGRIAKAIYVENFEEYLPQEELIKSMLNNFRGKNKELISNNLYKNINSLTYQNKIKIYNYFQREECQFIVGEYTRDINEFLASIFLAFSNQSINTLLPQYGVKKQLEEFKKINYSKKTFDNLLKSQDKLFENVLDYFGYTNQPVPPLTSILLSRCSNMGEIPEKLLQLRIEFSDLREVAVSFEEQIANVQTMKEQNELIKIYDNFWNTYDSSQNIIHRTFFRFWDTNNKMIPQFKHQGINNIKNITENRPSFNKQINDVERIFKVKINSKKEYHWYSNFADKIDKTISKQNNLLSSFPTTVNGGQHNYFINQAGAVGPNSQALGNTFDQENFISPNDI